MNIKNIALIKANARVDQLRKQMNNEEPKHGVEALR